MRSMRRAGIAGLLLLLGLTWGCSPPPRPEHVSVAASHERWEQLIKKGLEAYQDGNVEQAEKLLRGALEESTNLGRSDPRRLKSLSALATFYKEQGRLEEAVPLYREALRLGEELLGRDDPSLVPILFTLAHVHRNKGEPTLSEPLYRRIIALLEEKDGPGSPALEKPLLELADLLRERGDEKEAARLEERAAALEG